MSPLFKNDYLHSLLHELCKQSSETEWLEFKHNNCEPEAIGEYISALANSAAYHGKAAGYMVWGVKDETHEVIGTTFSPSTAKVGNENLENWLLRLLAPKLNFHFYEFWCADQPVVILEIQAASHLPVQFKQQEFIRIGSHKKKLKDHAERERDLWRIFDTTPFELKVALDHLNGNEVLEVLDYESYFKLLGASLPAGSDNILRALEAERLIALDDAGLWNITNLGAILFAKSLSNFPGIKRKAVRVIHYRGDGRIETIREYEGSRGYAVGFEKLIAFINDMLPSNEVIGQALRKEVPMFPELAIRELVANTIIHQDFNEKGNGPMIEIFSQRMEITNPGAPLMPTERFLDTPPKSRNELLASLMRRIGVCEERGSGVDKVVHETEYYQLPAPSFETLAESTRAVLFAHKDLSEMDKADKIRACYLHACLRFVERKDMTNSSLRERFSVKEKNRAIVSRIISDTLDAGLIFPFDENQGRRHAKYVPFWAGELTK